MFHFHKLTVIQNYLGHSLSLLEFYLFFRTATIEYCLWYCNLNCIQQRFESFLSGTAVRVRAQMQMLTATPQFSHYFQTIYLCLLAFLTALAEKKSLMKRLAKQKKYVFTQERLKLHLMQDRSPKKCILKQIPAGEHQPNGWTQPPAHVCPAFIQRCSCCVQHCTEVGGGGTFWLVGHNGF